MPNKISTRVSNSRSAASVRARTSQNNQTKKIRFKAPKTLNEKQIVARRDKEHQNLERWQKADKYFREMKARLELYENWDQRELRRTKSTGGRLNQLDSSELNQFNYYKSFNSLNYSLNKIDELEMGWSKEEKLIHTKSNQQLTAEERVENQLCSKLIDELYILDPRKIPYDIDVDLLRRPEAVVKLKQKVNKQELKLQKLKDNCSAVKSELRLKARLKTKLTNHKKQLEQLYLEYTTNWLPNWQQRSNRLELKCSDEELNLLFPARRGQVKGKDGLRLRNNLISEHFNRCQQLLQQVRKISGYFRMNKDLTSFTSKLEKAGEDDHRKAADKSDNQKNNLNRRQKLEQNNLENFESNNEMQSHLMQLLTDDERQVLANVLRSTINMLDTYTTLIKRRASLYGALYE